MFKPHKNICSSCGNEAIVVVKKMLCAKCNHEQKQAKRKAAGKKPSKSFQSYAYKEPTGEKDVFQVVLERYDDKEVKCFVCKEKLTLITHHNFAHVLRKGTYPKYRLNPDNIVLMCYKLDGTGCHSKFDFSPRSELKGEEWLPLFELETKLRKDYKNGK